MFNVGLFDVPKRFSALQAEVKKLQQQLDASQAVQTLSVDTLLEQASAHGVIRQSLNSPRILCEYSALSEPKKILPYFRD